MSFDKDHLRQAGKIRHGKFYPYGRDDEFDVYCKKGKCSFMNPLEKVAQAIEKIAYIKEIKGRFFVLSDTENKPVSRGYFTRQEAQKRVERLQKLGINA